jgi:aminoglycoside phosphotransferase (APT) family kinase protein
VVTVHPDEIVVPEDVVRRLLAAQFPQWAGLPLARVASYGTDNVLFRLGDDLCVRLPRLRRDVVPRWALRQIAKDAEWLPRLRPHLPVEVPEVVATGEPGEGYPHVWAVYRWLEGEVPHRGTRELARDVAAFLEALQRIDPADAPQAHDRGAPLQVRDEATRRALAQLEDEVDVPAATAAWEAGLRAPVWDRPPVWLHGDVLEGNLLVRDGRLTAVIDWSIACAGDPACDYAAAWSLFADVRDAFRAAAGVDDATWARARAFALSQALIALPYYLETNPPVVARSRRVVAEVLSEL